MKSNLINKILISLVLAFILIGTNLLGAQLYEIKADEFYPSGNIDNCKLASIISVGYNQKSLPTNIAYDASQIKGTLSNQLVNKKFTDLATYSFPSPQRYSNESTVVSVPPNTKVNFATHFWNYSNHDINLKNIKLFMSKENPEQGDLTRLGAVANINTLTFNNGNSSRTGKMLTIPGNYSLNQRNNNSGRLVFELETIQPINIIDRKVEYDFLDTGEVELSYITKIKNISTYNLCDLSYSQNLINNNQVYNKTFCLNSNEEIEIIHKEVLSSINSKTLEIKEGQVSDPNSHIESNSDSYKTQSDIYNFKARSLYVERNDSSNQSWFGIQPGWGNKDRGNISIELLPYQIPIKETSINLDIEREIITEVIDDNGAKKVRLNLISPILLKDSKIIFRHHGIIPQIINPIDLIIKEKESEILIEELGLGKNNEIIIETNLENPPIDIKEDIEIIKDIKIEWVFDNESIYKDEKIIFNFFEIIESLPMIEDIEDTESRQLVKTGIEFNKIFMIIILLIYTAYIHLNTR